LAKADIAKCWTRIEKWLAAKMPAALQFFPKGVKSAAISKAEKTLGFQLPSELAEFLAIRDGSGNLWLHDRGVFLSLAGIMEAWDNEFDLWGDGNNDEWASPQGPIKKKWFTRRWLPILDTWCGDYICIDLDPATGGKRGQLISWYHTNGPTQVVAPNLGTLLHQFAEELEAGRYRPAVNQKGRPYLENPGTSAEQGAADVT